MNPINTIIFNALKQRKSIVLPGIGSLSVVSTPAQMINKKTLLPPIHRVRFSKTENPEFTHLIDLIKQSYETTEEKAWEHYNEWYSAAHTEGTVTIEGTGVISNNGFTPTAELNRTLNPAGVTPRKVTKEMSSQQVTLWVVIAVIIGGVLSLGVIMWLNNQEEEYPGMSNSTQTTTAQHATPIASDSTTLNDSTKLAKMGVNPSVNETSKPTASTAVKESNSGAKSSTETNAKGYYVVVGLYSTEANANKFIAEAQGINSKLSYKKLVLSNGKIMIYTAYGANESDIKGGLNVAKQSYPEAWTFRYRGQ